MKNSQKYKNQIKEDKILCIIFTILTILFLSFLIINSLETICNIITIVITCSVIDILILIIGFSYLKNVGKLPENEKDKIYYELDNKVEKVFEQYNLYITDNYIVSIKSFKLFAIPIKDIQAIDTYKDSRYYHKYYWTKRGEKKKKWYKSFIDYIKASILTKIILYEDGEIHILNIICDKKVYNITTAHRNNKNKLKQIDAIAEYICNKNNNIDWI